LNNAGAIALNLAKNRIPVEDPCVLDVGCGNGWFLYNVKAHFPKATLVGLDLDVSAAVRNLAPVGGAILHECEVSRFKTDLRFDLITSFQVLEHVQNPGDYVDLVRRHAAASCLVLTDVPRLGSTLSRLCGRNWVNLDTPRHRVMYTRKALRRLLGDLGPVSFHDYGYAEDVLSSVFLVLGLPAEALMGDGPSRDLRRVLAKGIEVSRLLPLNDRTIAVVTTAGPRNPRSLAS
jgi:SAM-dependent methyltransferase